MMTVEEILADLKNLFPRSPIEAWAKTYRDALEGHEHEVRGRAYRVCMRKWTESYPPRPAHIVAEITATVETSTRMEGSAVCAAKDKRRTETKLMLYRNARDELHGWVAIARAEGWEYLLDVHLVKLCGQVAHAMVDNGRSLDDALHWANQATGNRKTVRQGWLDQDDADRLRSCAESQARVRAGRRAA